VHRLTFILALLFCSRPALSQASPQPAPQLSPQAAYEQATRPLEITRRSLQNWSDSETAALGVAVQQAKDNCSARSSSEFAGEDLIAFARLCALGQQWPSVQEAATLYVEAQRRATPAEKTTAFPGLSQAYAYLIDSSLHVNDPKVALASARDMLRSCPYNELASEATNETFLYLQLIQTDDALSLFAQRQPILLSLLRASSTPNANSTTEPKQTLPIHTIYADAIAFAALQRFTNQSETAAATASELEAALPGSLSSDDTILIAESRRQYALLGAPLPPISPSAYLMEFPATTPPRVNTSFGAATAFLLFPDWCAQCIRMWPQFVPAHFYAGQKDVQFYAVLAQDTPLPSSVPRESVSKSSRPNSPRTTHTSAKPAAAVPDPDSEPTKTAAETLRGTPTLVVSNDVLTRFDATDFPFLIVTDHQGIVRFLQPAPENVLVPGGLLDQVVARVLQQWPATPAK
jgi:hypothetical protein